MNIWVPWAAGFIDGEAAIRISYGRYRQQVCLDINVSQVCIGPLHKLQEMFGGSVRERKGKALKRKAWVWSVTGKNAHAVIKQIRPYLLVKDKHADVAIRFWKECGQPVGVNQKLDQHQIDARMGYYREMQKLQHKGVHLRK